VELVLFLLVLVLVATWVSAPLRQGGAGAAGTAAAEGGEAAALEREVRLAAIRDAELDARLGKLTEREHRELDAELRAEAIEALRRAQP
jgi:hypothetical protein